MPPDMLTRSEFKYYAKTAPKEEYYSLLTSLQPDETEHIMHKACILEEKRITCGKTYAPMIDEQPSKEMYDLLKVEKVFKVSFEDVRKTMEKNAAADAAKTPPPTPPPAPPRTSGLPGAEVGSRDMVDLVPSNFRPPIVARKPPTFQRDENLNVEDGSKKKRKRKSEPPADPATDRKSGESFTPAPKPKKQKRGDPLDERKAAHQTNQASSGVVSKPSENEVTAAQKKADKTREKNKKKREKRKLNKAQGGQVTAPARPDSTSDKSDTSKPAVGASDSTEQPEKTFDSAEDEEDAKSSRKCHGKSRSERRRSKNFVETSTSAEQLDQSLPVASSPDTEGDVQAKSSKKLHGKSRSERRKAKKAAETSAFSEQSDKSVASAATPDAEDEKDTKPVKKGHGKGGSERRRAKKAAAEQQVDEDAEMADAAVSETQLATSTASAVSTNAEGAAAKPDSIGQPNVGSDRPKKKVRRSRHKSKTVKDQQDPTSTAIENADTDIIPAKAGPVETRPDVHEDEKTASLASDHGADACKAQQPLPQAVSHTALPTKPAKRWEVTADRPVAEPAASSGEQSPVTFDSLMNHLEQPAVGLNGNTQLVSELLDAEEREPIERFKPDTSTATAHATPHSDGFMTAAETVSPTASTFKTPFARSTYNAESPWTPVPTALRTSQGTSRGEPSAWEPALPSHSSLGQTSLSSFSVVSKRPTISMKQSQPRGKVTSIPEYDDTEDVRANFRRFNAVVNGKNPDDIDSDDSSDDESSSSSSDSDSDAGHITQASGGQAKTRHGEVEAQPLPTTKDEKEDAPNKASTAYYIPLHATAIGSKQQPDTAIESSVAQDTKMADALVAAATEEDKSLQDSSEEGAPINTFDPEAIEVLSDDQPPIMNTMEPQSEDPLITFASIRRSLSPTRSQVSPTPMLPDLPELLSYGGYIPQSDDSEVGSVQGDDSKIVEDVEIDLMSYLPDDTETPRFVRPLAIEYSSPATRMSEHESDLEMETGGANLDLEGSIYSAAASQHSTYALQNAPQVSTIPGTADAHHRKSPPADLSELEEPVTALDQDFPDHAAEDGRVIERRFNLNEYTEHENDEDRAMVNADLTQDSHVESPVQNGADRSSSNENVRPTTPVIIIERIPTSERSLYKVYKQKDPAPVSNEAKEDEAGGDSDTDSAISSPLSELSQSPSPVSNSAGSQPKDSEHEEDEEEAEIEKPKSKPTKKRKMTGTISKHFTPSPAKRPRVPAGVSAVPFPRLSAPRFGLIQEELAISPFRLLLAVTFLNKTKGKTAVPIYRQLMERYPTPQALASANESEVSAMIYSLGFQNQRARKLIRLAQSWLDNPPQKGIRHRTRDYPVKGDGRNLKPADVVEEDADEVAGALEIGHMYGCGPYAWDSWRIFCRDVLRGVATGYNGEGVPGYEPPAPLAAASPVKLDNRTSTTPAKTTRREAPPSSSASSSLSSLTSSASSDFEPEWKRVIPLDKELRACLRWMWLREGWEWDPLTGNRRPASVQTMREACAGEATWEEPMVLFSPFVKTGEEEEEEEAKEILAREIEGPAGEEVEEDVVGVGGVSDDVLIREVGGREVGGGTRRSMRVRRVEVEVESSGSSEDETDEEDESGESEVDERIPVDIDDSFEDPDYGDDSP